MHLPLLQDLLILLGFSAVVVFLLQRLRLPSILGFLLTGILIGPSVLGWVHSDQIELISEIGVILLLFVIGMELSIRNLISIRNTVFLGGALQVGLTVLLAGGIFLALGADWKQALVVGFLFSLSSTAIVLKMMQDRKEISAPHGRNALAVLIFQDIVVVPMMLLVPIIAGESGNVMQSLLSLLIKTTVVLVLTVLSARFLVPRLMHHIARTGSKELFLIATVTICFAVAFLTAEIGLSLALGAFLAGLIISESEYSFQATSIILPFRELFISFFFISVGMLLDLAFFAGNFGYILLILIAVFLGKSAIATLAMAILGHPSRTSLLTGFALFQVGEFAFILSKVGIQYGLLTFETNQYFLSVSIVSMMLTPFVIIVSENLANRLVRWRPIQAVDERISFRTNPLNEGQGNTWSNHLVILGYGTNGSNLARAAAYSNIPFVAVELDADRVREEKKKGVPILYGDVAQPHILEQACLGRARVVVLAISDPAATRVVIQNVRQISKTVQLVVRTRYVKEIPELLALGADDVIPEEFETSIEIFSRALHYFLVPEDDIEHLVEEIRDNNYGVLQGQNFRPRTFRPANFPDFRISCLSVRTDDRSFVGKTVQELDIRNRYEVNILGISREGELESSVRNDQRIHQHDILYVIGNNQCIEEFRKRIE